MKKIYMLIFYSLFLISHSFGQGGTWTWISGSKALNSAGVYGTQGIPSVNNHPPSNYEMVEWKDKKGNFWLYGGGTNAFSDMWKFNPSTLEWTWVKGNAQLGLSPVWGTKGVAAASNSPGVADYGAATWVDTSGALWLFGGENAPYPDLWRYDIGTNEWTWVNGPNSLYFWGHHGTMGIPDSANYPGVRNEAASAWTDSLNNLWLFGGYGYDDGINFGYLNDMMKYDISTNEWTWIKGSAFYNAAAVYGTKGVMNATNDPGGRFTHTRWKDNQGNFWLSGGSIDAGNFNDVWKYSPDSNQWTWMAGPNTVNGAGIYGTKCVFSGANTPGARYEQRATVTDNCGRFWLMGGVDNGATGFTYGYNDLWLFDPQLLQWKWLSGAQTINQAGNYGTIGVPSPGNVPPSRIGANAWWGNDNKYYLFGGAVDRTVYPQVPDCRGDLWVFSPDTSCIPVCNVVTAPPSAAFQSSKTSICENDCINFTDMSTNATSWLWSFAGALDSTSTAQNPQGVCYSKAGIYNVTFVASNSKGSDTVTITNYINVIAAPPSPNITQHHDTLLCSTNSLYSSYQWSLDSTPITGATDTLLVVSKSGNYNIQVADENGCRTATGINITIGIQNYANDNIISLSPNPATNQLTIHSSSFHDKVVMVSVINVLGQSFDFAQSAGQAERSPAERSRSITIDISNLPSGMYFLQMRTEGGSVVKKFVKQ